jgi:protein TIF31
MSDENKEQKQQEQSAVDERIVSLKIQIPETEDKLEIPCSVEDSLFDIIETLKLLPSTREYTSYELRSGSAKLSEETLISDLVEGNEDSASISLVPSPYNEITARRHVIAAREYANLETKADSLAEILGVGYGQSTYSDLGLVDTKLEEKSKEEKENAENPKVTVTDEEKSQISSLVSEIIELKSDINVVSAKKTLKELPALKALFVSQWSPSSFSRKLAGDLFYLQAQTLEGEIFNITAHVSGFFVNNSSNTRFDGSVHSFKTDRNSFNYSLLSLLKSLSPAFAKQLQENEMNLSKHSLETYIVPNSTSIASPWLVKDLETPAADLGKSQYTLLHGGVDGADLQVDWNKNYQLLKDLEKSNLTQRFNREQSLISNNTAFTVAAVKGALAIVRGEIDPVNLEEDSAYHIYMQNGIFYSKAVDSIGQFETSGGAEAARSTVGKDVASLKYLNKFDLEGVHSLLTTVVDYLGHRIVCQAPVPGIFSSNDIVLEEGEEPEQTVKYGFIDDHSDVASEETFVNTFKEVGEAFHLKPHKIWNNDGSKVVDVVTSGYSKGIKGTDGRVYIIDMFRSTPLDIEFIEENYDESNENSYPHKETLLRHEAINEWIKRETAVAVKKETDRLEKEGKVNSENKPTIGVDNSLFLLNPDAFSLAPAPTPELAAELKKDEDKVREVSRFVGQILVPEFVKDMEETEVYNAIDGTHLSEILHSNGINIRYLGKIAKLALERKAEFLKSRETSYVEISDLNKTVEKEEAKELEEKKAKSEAKLKARKEAAEKGEDVPDFKKELEEEKAAEEQKELDESKLPTKVNTIPVPALLDSLYEISVSEMISRATKHFLRKQLQSIPLPLAPYVISHVHNCLLVSKANPTPAAPTLDSLLAAIYKDVDLSILEKDSKYVLDAISKEVFIRFRFTLSENWVDSIKPIKLLRSIALKFGIQWKQREFAMTRSELDAQIAEQTEAAKSINNSSPREEKNHKKKGRKFPAPKQEPAEVTIVSTTFVPQDIVCVAPVIKDSVFESTAVSDAWETGLIKLLGEKKEDLQEGAIFANQAVQFCERLYGPVHNITATYLAKLGSLYASSNETGEAVLLLQKAFQIFERCAGVDSYQASQALNQLASACLSNNQIVNSVKIYKRLLNYWILAFDEYHPNVVSILTAVAVLLMRLQMNGDAIKIFIKGIELSEKIGGEVNQQAAFFRYQLAQLYFAENRYKDAVEQGEKAFEIFKTTLGLKDKSTIDARKLVTGLKNYSEYMKHQAKNLHEKEQEARKLEQQQNLKAKQNQKAKQVAPNPELANKSVDDIVAFISGTSDGKKKKANNIKKKNSKK